MQLRFCSLIIRYTGHVSDELRVACVSIFTVYDIFPAGGMVLRLGVCENSDL
jgi:hypothetical protein